MLLQRQVFPSVCVALASLSHALNQRSPIFLHGFDAKSLYFPCAPVEVYNEDQDLTFTGQRCSENVGVEMYSNIKFAVDFPIGGGSGYASFTYPTGSVIDTAFSSAFCHQLPGLPFELSYEHLRGIEEANNQPVAEDCLTLSIVRPADLPDDLNVLIAPSALSSTHQRGLLPVTLVTDESGPRKEGDHFVRKPEERARQGEEATSDQPYIYRPTKRSDVVENAVRIVQRDMKERGTGRVIVIANFVTLDVGGRQKIVETMKTGLERMRRDGEIPATHASSLDPNSTVDGVCRSQQEFQRLQALIRARNAAGPDAIEWPLYKSARGRKHNDLLKTWIKDNIEVWSGDSTWLQEVVILPEGAMSRSTSDPKWRAQRLVGKEQLDSEMFEIAMSGSGGKMNIQMPL